MTSRRGFTLVELLVATILLTVVMTSVYTMFYAVLVPWRAVETDYDAYRAARNAATLIDREFANLLPGAAHLFEGKKDEVTLYLVSEPMDVEKSEGRHVLRVRYRFKKATNELVREEALVVSPLPQPAQENDKEPDATRLKVKQKQEFVVATGVEDFDLRYVWMPQPFPIPKPGDPPSKITPLYAKQHSKKWHLGYPQAVEMTLTLKDPEKKGKTQEILKTIPIRIGGGLHPAKQLTAKIGSMSS